MELGLPRSRSFPLLKGVEAALPWNLPQAIRMEAPSVENLEWTIIKISRSKSAPSSIVRLNTEIMNKSHSLDGAFQVVPSPRVSDIGRLPDTVALAFDNGGGGQDIIKEEAACRICLEELSGGSNTFKLECQCKGELALAHKDCAVKWFSLRGNRNCEVCNQEVLNLSVKLVRTHAGNCSYLNRLYQPRTWENLPSFSILSIFAYFCFLEEMLMGRHGWGAMGASLPFACILGAMSSLTAIIMVRQQFIWIYATVQFLLVLFFAQLLYCYVRMPEIGSIVVGAFIGIGTTMVGKFVLFEILRWRLYSHEQSLNAAGHAQASQNSSTSEAVRSSDEGDQLVSQV